MKHSSTAAALGLFALLSAHAASLENDLVRIELDGTGRTTRLVEKGTDRVLADGRAPFVAVERADGRTLEPTAFELRDGAARWTFPGGGAVALGVTPFAGGWTFEVREATVPDAKRLRVGGFAGVACADYSSDTSQCVSDLKSGLAVRGYEYVSHGVYGRETHLFLEADRPLAGRKFGLAAGPRAKLVEALKAMTVQSGFPHTKAGGAWATGSEQCRGSYLNANVTVENVDDFIAAALLGGFDVVHFRENWYARLGHYPVNTNDFPRGLADLKDAVAKVHAAGLRAGLHTLTGCIDPRDPWITPVCSPDLMNWATYTLAAPLADGATELLVEERPVGNHDVIFSYSGNGNALRIGGEIVQYAGVRREKPYGFTGIVRGAFGTRVTPHARGERVAYLQQRYRAFYPDPDSPLARELAENIARVYRTCGFDQIYLDGTEGMMTEYGMAKMRALIYGACTRDGRPCLAEDSHGGGGAGAWWFHSRKGAWDSTYWAPKRFHDFHVAAMRAANPRLSEFREIQMGWWCPCAGSDEHRAHAWDDMEYYAGKNAALDASMSVAGVNPTFKGLLGNWLKPSGFEVFGQLAILGWYERFRRAGAFRPWLTEHLAVPRREARLRQDADGVWRAAKMVSKIHRVAGRETAAWRETFAEKPSSAIVRIEALGTCAAEQAKVGLAAAEAAALAVTSAPSVRAERPRVANDPQRGAVAVLRATNAGTTPRGAWAAARRAFAPYADIGNRRAIACWVKGDGSGALANFQVESPREYSQAYSEHYVRLDFTGWRFVEMPFSETDVEQYCDLVWPYSRGYAPFFHRQITGGAVSAVSVYLNEIPAGKTAEVAFTDVRFVAKKSVVEKGLALTVNGVRHEVPFDLKTGETAECEDGFWTHLDVNRTPLKRVAAAKPVLLAAGANDLALAAREVVGGAAPRAEVTLFAVGEKKPALADLAALTPARRSFLDRECGLPVLYAPADGFDALPALAVRPGERAEPSFTVRGPIGPFELSVGGETRRFRGVRAGASFTAPRGTFARTEGSVPVRVKPLDATPAHATFLFSKTYPFCAAGPITLENDVVRLTLGADACAKSLVVKATGEELLLADAAVPFLAAVQDRPFHNEWKLIHPNKRTVYRATALRAEGADRLIVGFENGMYEAVIRVTAAHGYLAFAFEDFRCDRKATYDYLKMDIPPVVSLRLAQLPVKERKNFGNWLNACWDASAAVAVVGTSMEADIDHEDLKGGRLLYGELFANRPMRGEAVALVTGRGREPFLDAMDELEVDFKLPRGVRSRRNPLTAEPIFNLGGGPETLNELIPYVKKGGFKLIMFGQGDFTHEIGSWGKYGDYDLRRDFYPNGLADVTNLLARLHAEGFKVGFHTLHSHIGLKSRYVTPVADPRLNKTRRFTLAEPLPLATNDLASVTVQEPTFGTVLYEPCRVLQFGGELLSYESYTTEPPYRFLGVKRGVHATRPQAHERGQIGGILDISEFGRPLSCYLDQDSDLQDEVADKLAAIYNCGFDFAYLDGSEGVNRPFNYNVSRGQYRYWRKLVPEPIYGEGAAKTHFDWHFMAGANAFDCFGPKIFKEMLRKYPFAQAPIAEQEMTRVDFGWWGFWAPGQSDWWNGREGVQADMWEYGASVATAWNCAISIYMGLPNLKAHPRSDDILETLRRWNEVRRKGISDAWRAELKDVSHEHHLYRNERGEYELVRWEMVSDGLSKDCPVRAFAFTRGGETYLAYWHATGSGSFTFDLGNGPETHPADNLRYLKSRKSVAELKRAPFVRPSR